MTGKEEERTFVEGVLGRRWDNFPARVAAVNYHRLIIHGSPEPVSERFKEKLLRLISKDDLEKVIAAHGKLKKHPF